MDLCQLQYSRMSVIRHTPDALLVAPQGRLWPMISLMAATIGGWSVFSAAVWSGRQERCPAPRKHRAALPSIPTSQNKGMSGETRTILEQATKQVLRW